MTLQIGMKALKRTTTKVGRNNNHGFAFNFITSRDIVHYNSNISIPFFLLLRTYSRPSNF